MNTTCGTLGAALCKGVVQGTTLGTCVILECGPIKLFIPARCMLSLLSCMPYLLSCMPYLLSCMPYLLSCVLCLLSSMLSLHVTESDVYVTACLRGH